MLDKFYFFKGRVALYAILKAMGIGQRDEVILPGFTCVVVPNAISYLGAKPVYVDIDPYTYNIDPSLIEDKITERTKSIIAQHTFGIPAEMDKIIDIAKKHNLYVIEDSCHAIGSKYKGKEVGTFGNAAFFSSQWSKPITTGLGGWAVVNNERLIENMKRIYPEFLEPSYREKLLLRVQYLTYSKLFKPSLFWFAQNTYRTLSKFGITIGSSTNRELECEMPDGYTKKMSTWQSNLLEKKFEEIDRYVKHRKWVSFLYRDFLRQGGMKTLDLPEDHEPVFLRYPVLVKDKRKVLEEAKNRRIEIGDWFISPVHPNLDGWEKAGYKKGTCHIAEEICEHVVNLPTHCGVEEKYAKKIAEFLADVNKM